jgi:hypothetical protein
MNCDEECVMVVKGGIARHLLWLVIHPKRGKPGFNFAPGGGKNVRFSYIYMP